MKAMGLHDRVEFGKYKGCTIEKIIEVNPEYLSWAIHNNVLELDNETYSIYQRSLPVDPYGN